MSHHNTSHKLSPLVLWVMTLATCFVVANIYYNQPLLGDIASTFHISSSKAGQIAMYTQIGYATGLLFIIPLADRFKRKRLMLIDLLFVIASLLLAAGAKSVFMLGLASFWVGVTSVIPQVLVAMAAHLAEPHERGRKIGFIMSGLLIGILLSRTISGFVGEHLGWRAMFYIAAALMVVMFALIAFLVPEVEPHYSGTYWGLMKSLGIIIKDEPTLRLASLRGALCFAGFSAFWTVLVFLLQEPQFNLGSDIAGAFGLIGAFGALAASLIGRLSDRINTNNLILYTLLILLSSFVVFIFSGHSIWGLILGVILLDMGVQATHISNQTIIFSLNPSARNRINTVYMVSYFIGGSAGTYLSSVIWGAYRWTGVCILGIILTSVALIVHLLSLKKQH